MRRKGLVLAAVLVSISAAGCGTSETKRAADPRTEVLRFFPSQTPLVGLLRTDRLGQVPTIDGALSGIPGYRAVVARLRQAGISNAQLRRLVHREENEEGIGPPELAFGASSLDALEGGGALMALDTGDEARLSRSFEAFASRGGLSSAGELHDADLYVGRGAAFAVRDGVLVAGADLEQVRSAIETRDGDRDRQLDDGEVGALFDELPEGAPIHIYADFGALITADAAASALAQDVPWLAALGQGALSAAAVGPAVEIDAFARLDRTPLEEGEAPAGEEFAPVSVTRGTLRLLLPGDGGDPLREVLLAVAPVTGVASASPDELRVSLRLPS